MRYPDFDLIVVGGGHAGVEAALAAARLGKSVAMVTMDSRRLALMSCNPAVGGIGKSHIVKEIDALGGIMGLAADAAGIQFRRLNLSRGPAVWSTRVQADRDRYRQFIVDFVSSCHRIDIVEGIADQIIVEAGHVVGVRTESGETLSGHTVLLSTGTFLGGMIHIGEKQIRAGRIGEPAAVGMTQSLVDHGFEVGRLKTGTPPRLDGATIDFDRCTRQPGDNPIPWFSCRTIPYPVEQVPCHLTYTTIQTKELITAQSHRSPIFSGQISSRGPRYCPSIEDKFFRFADKERHQIFLEPEGNGTNEIYPNGFSTALPEEVQEDGIRTIIGLEKAEITRPGYAIEYDYCPTYQIKPSLESRLISGLFLAGQINGTSGYEEAAGQGLMAGLNAARKIDREPAVILDRSTAYIGVMIDDLCTRSTTEPYRMFTSRAEYRLALREDNARDRLSRLARNCGLIDESEFRAFCHLQQETDQAAVRFGRVRVPVASLGELGERFQKTDSTTLENLMRQPNVSLEQALELVDRFDDNGDVSREALERAIISLRYAGYIDKQQREIDRFHKLEAETIPDYFSYEDIKGLKQEALEKFLKYRPASIGQAGRIEGVSPGDIAVLAVHVRRSREKST